MGVVFIGAQRPPAQVVAVAQDTVQKPLEERPSETTSSGEVIQEIETLLAGVSPENRIKLCTEGEHLIDLIPFKTGEKVLSLQVRDGVFEIVDATVNVSVPTNGYDTEYYRTLSLNEYPGELWKHVAVFETGKRIHPGKVVRADTSGCSVPTDADQALRHPISCTLTIGTNTYTVSGEAAYIELPTLYNSESTWAYFLTLHNGTTQQLLPRLTGFYFAGDLDGDGALDLLIEQSQSGLHRPRKGLYLSSGASDGSLLGIVGAHEEGTI